jgi:hypothetical protein
MQKFAHVTTWVIAHNLQPWFQYDLPVYTRYQHQLSDEKKAPWFYLEFIILSDNQQEAIASKRASWWLSKIVSTWPYNQQPLVSHQVIVNLRAKIALKMITTKATS